ncbi:MAG TPA: hypothetical protein VGK34_04720 [Armatimonadota bacterium]|jgi:hypothetical protein
MTKWFCVLTLFLATCAAALAQNTDAVYQIMKHDLPSSIQPGQRIVGHLNLKCVSPGKPLVNYPSLEASGGGVDFTPPGDRLIPWEYTADKAVPGAVLEQAFTLDVPLNLPPGEAVLSFSINGDGGRTATLLDASGKSIGKVFAWKCRVRSVEGPPAVIGAMKAPKLDGRINADEWKGAGTIPAFVNNADGTPASIVTSMRLGHDDKNLYVAIVASEPNLSGAKAVKMEGRDPNNYLNEAVELLLEPKADRVSYYHFVADILGQKYDALGSDCYGYNPEWQVASYKGDKFWSVEIAIPYTAVASGVPASGDAWLANFARDRYAGGSFEPYTWKATRGSYAATGTFAPIVFDSLKLNLEKSGRKLASESSAWPADVKSAASGWLSELAAWQSTVEKTSTVDEGSYETLAYALSGLEKSMERYRMKALSSLSGGNPFYITRSFPYEPFKGRNMDIDTKLGPIDLTLLKDEWTDVAMNITNVSEKSIAIRLTSRYGRSEEVAKLGLPGLETLWQEAVPVASKDGKPAWDAVQPIPAGAFQIPAGETKQVWLSVHVPKDYRGAQNVTGTVKIESIDGTPGKSMLIPITVNVIPQVLTEKSPVHGFTWNLVDPALQKDSPQWVQATYDDLKSHGIDMCMLHNLSTAPRPLAKADGTLEPMDFTKMDLLLDASKDKFSMYYVSLDIWEKTWVRKDLFGLDFPSPAYQKAFTTWLNAIVDRLKQHGIGYDRFVVNAYDESVSDNCYFIARWVREADPKIRMVLDSIGPVDIVKKFERYNDVWMPHFNSYQAQENQPSIDLMRKEGKDLWVYWYSEGGNEKQQHPTKHYMYKYWWAFKNNVTGVGYWAQQYYGDPWDRAEATQVYDTSLVYPTETGVIPSRRWQAWRQGWQDYCLLDLCRKELAARKDTSRLEKMNSLVNRVVQFPADPANFDAARDYAKQVLAGK